MAVTPVASHDLQSAWRETAVRQGLLCLVCSEVPSLDHRDAFYDTGLCESCSQELVAAEVGAAP
jgi:hypothetical protein